MMRQVSIVTAVLVLCSYLLSVVNGRDSVWTEWWWTYDGISGPAWWGSKWPVCRLGKYQSPIDIKPDMLLFDPGLTGIVFSSSKKINGNLTNTGNDITFFVDDVLMPYLNVTAGPLQYNYRLHHMKLHFGHDESQGSEHTINGLSFPAELQLLTYNADLYNNYTHALSSPNGLAAFAIFLEVGEVANEAFSMISDALSFIPTKGQHQRVSGVPLHVLLPATPQYLTYEGSLTQPQCQETVTWVIFNKPIYILRYQLEQLRNINKEGGSHLLIFGNLRPSQPVNNRLIRTNIGYKPKTKACSMAKEVFYEVNTIKPRNRR
ncbi:carbonic anhydrase-related protein 10-like isoform X2 [Mya arenaria]|uniref:carbonic anhydrase-related protein 10-like isoform X2 n=1 Tax=Mya arenaria TaxID=6604 RepID=UPI0022E54F9B|nr:carbonic anhydrase-related protein 10-like isoform X2 [Mya arenaria]